MSKFQLPLRLTFDPATNENLKEVYAISNAWKLWMLWKAGHIVCQNFNEQCITAGKLIEEKKPTTTEELMECFPHRSATGNFNENDLKEFCEEALPYFAGGNGKEVPVSMPPRTSATTLPPEIKAARARGWKQPDYNHAAANDMWHHEDCPLCEDGRYISTEEMLEYIQEENAKQNAQMVGTLKA